MSTFGTIKDLLTNYKDEGLVNNTSIGNYAVSIFKKVLHEKGINIKYLHREGNQKQFQKRGVDVPMFDIDLSEPIEGLNQYFPRPKYGIRPHFDICNMHDKNSSKLYDFVTNEEKSHDTQYDILDDDDGALLGWYEAMYSPGKIVFCTDIIKEFTNEIVGELLNTSLKGARRWDVVVFTILLIVEDVRIHESFHYYCDVKRTLTDSIHKRNLEEALAVAHAYMEVKSGFSKAKIKDFFRGTPLEVAIEKYCESSSFQKNYNMVFPAILDNYCKGNSLPGYCDWVLYNDPSHYDIEFYDYLNDLEGKADFLRANGINVINVPLETKLLGMKGAQVFTYEDGALHRTEFRGLQSVVRKTSSKNHDKYELDGTHVGGKRQLVLKTITKHSLTHKTSTSILTDFPIKGTNPIIKAKSALRVNDKRNYFITPHDILHLDDGEFVVYNQWGQGALFNDFIRFATIAGYRISIVP